MKRKIIIAYLIALASTACVQKAYLKTVIIKLTVKNKNNIKQVGIRGNGNPLSWEKDFAMQEVVKDSVYTATVCTMTAYKFGEIKFVVDGEWELKDEPNRRIVFSETSDTTYVQAIFNNRK